MNHKRSIRLICLLLCLALLLSTVAFAAGSDSPLLQVGGLGYTTVDYGSTLEQAQKALPDSVSIVYQGAKKTYPSASETLFEDNFTDLEKSAENWTAWGNTDALSFSEGRMNIAQNNNIKVFAGDENWTDYVAECKLRVEQETDNGRNFGMTVRVSHVNKNGTNSDAYSGYYIGIWAGTKDNIIIAAAPSTSFASGPHSYPIEFGKDYTIKVVAFGDKITLFIDGNKVCQLSDAKYTNGMIGVRSYEQAFASTGYKVRTVTEQDLADCGIEVYEDVTDTAKIASWACDEFDGTNPGNYTFIGTIADSAKYSNPNGLTASAQVIVKKPVDKTIDPAKSVPNAQVKINDEFWSARQKQFICQVIPFAINNLVANGYIGNFDNAAKKNRGEEHGRFMGMFFVDSDVYKTVESMAMALEVDPRGDQEIIDGQKYIEHTLNSWIPLFQGAQEESGYLDTCFTLDGHQSDRWTDFGLHELYCMGHFIEAAVAHYRATGDDRLLNVATKCADYLTGLFGTGEGQWKQTPGHQEIELALVKLANLCNEIGEKNGEDYTVKADKYVELAQFFLDVRGDMEGRHEHSPAGSDVQDHLPVVAQYTATGHAVRAQYMYTGMADVAMYEYSDKYNDVLTSLWEDVTYTKQYVTGGIGNTKTNEGFADSYELANGEAYCETCACIANAMWNLRMNQMFGESKYIDQLETDLYNGILSCVNFSGNGFFYQNPMTSDGNRTRSVWFATACCPPNLMRTVEGLGAYLYTQRELELTVNLYVGNEAEIEMNGNHVGLTMTSDMPWEGNAGLTLSMEQSQKFAIRFRVPSWATGRNTIHLNGKTVSATPDSDGYVVLDRVWSDGDTVTLNFPMEAVRTYTDERVTSNVGYTAIKRGPVVYAAENVDNTFGLTSANLPKSSKLTTTYVDNITGSEDPYGLEHMVTIQANGEIMTVDGKQEVTWNLIPYYAWNNRANKSNSMRVYLSEQPLDETRGIEAFATASAFFTCRSDNVNGLNDGIGGENSNFREHTNSWTAYGYDKSQTAWVQYDLPKEVTLSGCSIQWMHDGGGVRFPKGLDIQYWDGEKFVSVEKDGEYTEFNASKDTKTYNTYLFTPVKTSKIRLIIEPTAAPGIAEWKLIGSAGESGLIARTVSAPVIEAVTTNSVKLSTAVISAGQDEGTVRYGVATVNDPAQASWQFSNKFSGLSANTTYYFFAKIDGTDKYVEAVSEGTEAKTLQYEITMGANQILALGACTDTTFRSNAPFAKFAGVKINGETLAAANYIKSAGSTNVTLRASYLNTLTAGTYTLTILATDGEASTTFSIVTEVDKSMLQQKIAEASRLNGDDYTADSWAGVIDALNKANEIMSKATATEEEVAGALNGLQNAMNGLVRKPSDPVIPVNPVTPVTPKPSNPAQNPQNPDAAANAPKFPFVDVPSTSWYYDSVREAWENGLIDGVTANEFKPDSQLTVAQAIKLAAALHQMQKTGSVTLTNGSPSWYDSYVAYAVNNGVVEKAYLDYTKAQMNAPATRGEFVHIFNGALVDATATNTVADNKIPDVKTTDKYGAEIYKFYRAGITVGSDAQGTFHPASNIKRSEVAAIVLRMFDTAARKGITMN